jgi:hypothetical protein
MRKGRDMRRIVGLLLFAVMSGAAVADTIDFLPPNPVSSSPFVVHIHGFLGYSYFGVPPIRTTIHGSIIQIEGCLPGSGFAVGSDYFLNVAVGPLAPGTYNVQYYTSLWCNSNPILAAIPPTLSVTAEVTIGVGNPESIPTLTSPAILLLLSCILAVAAHLLRFSKTQRRVP